MDGRDKGILGVVMILNLGIWLYAEVMVYEFFEIGNHAKIPKDGMGLNES